MHEEIEAKLKVDSLEVVERRLSACGASLLGETVQTDAYFDTVAREFTRGDKALRLRRERIGQHERLILAYKGPKQADDYKKRVEVELEVSDGEVAEALLAALGYNKALAFDKRRRLWRLRDCEVALDELPLLGTFVEIEGPDSHAILQVQEMLDLSRVPHTRDSYASLIERELSRLGRDRREVYLEDRK
ncbi:MAG: class IV adenylate cyclase [Planctomycetes bacterium]|nr:class IV adenylate cyclase [Planctomycetota bacterium]